jgi:hypothetical protein
MIRSQQTGNCSHISVGSSKHIACVNSSGNIYKWNGSGWDSVSGNAKKVAIGKDGTSVLQLPCFFPLLVLTPLFASFQVNSGVSTRRAASTEW